MYKYILTQGKPPRRNQHHCVEPDYYKTTNCFKIWCNIAHASQRPDDMAKIAHADTFTVTQRYKSERVKKSFI